MGDYTIKKRESMRLFLVTALAAFSLWAQDSNITVPVSDAEPETTFISDTHLLTHKKNYVLFFLNDFSSHNQYRDAKESMFQISLKRKLLNKIFHQNMQLYFGYTQKSFWQIYDGANSRPFRETNYNPELFVTRVFPESVRAYGLTHFYAGYEHESNGQSILTSRSWDRFYAKIFYTDGPFGADFKVWSRLAEPRKKDPTDPYGDDNPDIADYYGYGEFNVRYDYYGHRFGLFLRRRAVALDVSIPFGEVFFYTRYFNGYGESLIDYNEYVQKLGFGIQLNR